MHQPATQQPVSLACLWGFGLAACGGESSDALLDQAKPSIARRDTKAAINQLNNAVVVDENNAEARQRFEWMLATSSTITLLHLPWAGIKRAPVRNWIICLKAVWTSGTNLPFRP